MALFRVRLHLPRFSPFGFVHLGFTLILSPPVNRERLLNSMGVVHLPIHSAFIDFMCIGLIPTFGIKGVGLFYLQPIASWSFNNQLHGIHRFTDLTPTDKFKDIPYMVIHMRSILTAPRGLLLCLIYCFHNKFHQCFNTMFPDVVCHFPHQDQFIHILPLIELFPHQNNPVSDLYT